MEFNFIGDGIEAIVIDNFYTSEEYASVLNSCLEILPYMRPPEDTAGAVSIDGSRYIKSNHGVFIAENSPTPVNVINRTKIDSDEFKNSLIEISPLYKMYRAMNNSSTLLSYYSDGDYYDTHVDISVFTIVVYLYKEPKLFERGDLTLYSCYDNVSAEVESRPNRAVIFPSCTPHKVSKVQSKRGFSKDNGDGRFCISHFVNLKDPRL
jgi:hypothetical protein